MFRKFMYGRYGNDQLNVFLLVSALPFGLLSIIFGGFLGLAFTLTQYVILAFWAMRFFSKNVHKRRSENMAFLGIWRMLQGKFSGVSGFFSRLKDRKHKYFKCPKCKSRLRVPRGRGEITVTCPRCRNRFDKKS